MAALEENNALFPIFILTIMALALVPYTILKLCRAASKQIKITHCKFSEPVTALFQESTIGHCSSGFRTSQHTVTLVLLWVVMIVLDSWFITSKARASRIKFSIHTIFLVWNWRFRDKEGV